MKPKFNNNDKAVNEMKAIDQALINEADNAPGTENDQKGMTEQELRVESCKMAAKIAKLFDEVSPSDMLEIADTCYKYIKYQQTGGEYDPTFGLDEAEKKDEEDEVELESSDSESADDEDENEDFEIDMDSDEKKDSGEDSGELENTNEGGDEIPADFLDFTV